MKVFNNVSNFEKSLIIAYFLIGFFEVVFEIIHEKTFQYFIKFALTLLLVMLYWYASKQQNPLFVINLIVLMIGRLYMMSSAKNMLLYALIAAFFHRIIEVYYISKLLKLKDIIPPILASLPFLVFFLYMVSIPENVLVRSYVVLLVHIVLVSILCGIILSHYILTFDKKDVWLLIFGLMTLMHTFIIFIEKFYLSDFVLNVFRPSALLLNIFVCFAFYKFVIATERLNDN